MNTGVIYYVYEQVCCLFLECKFYGDRDLCLLNDVS